MSVMQRRRGVTVTIYPSKLTTDRRGNATWLPDEDAPLLASVWVIPERGARAEMAGQMDIDVTRMGTKSDLAGVNIWSRVKWDGVWYDMVTPPAHHEGTRHSRHWSIVIRKRPDDGALDG